MYLCPLDREHALACCAKVVGVAPYAPVLAYGAFTALDSGEPRCRKTIESTTNEATARNSLCQFWNDSNQNCEVRMNSAVETVVLPWASCSWL